MTDHDAEMDALVAMLEGAGLSMCPLNSTGGSGSAASSLAATARADPTIRPVAMVAMTMDLISLIGEPSFSPR